MGEIWRSWPPAGQTWLMGTNQEWLDLRIKKEVWLGVGVERDGLLFGVSLLRLWREEGRKGRRGRWGNDDEKVEGFATIGCYD